jgi:putative nucleotidyltransferase with HDIG domain
VTSDLAIREDFVRRLSAAIRAGELYAANHPLVTKSIDNLMAVTAQSLSKSESAVVGFLGNDVVVNDMRLGKLTAQLVGFVRDMHERDIEKISFSQGVTRDELQILVELMRDRAAAVPITDRLASKGIRRIAIGKLMLEADDGEHVGIVVARKVYKSAVDTAETLWDQAKAGDKPDPNAARKIIDSLAKVVTQDRTSLMALTALKQYDNYTFTHMVNVSVLAMSQARALNLDGPLLREFGFAALMHDIGKVNTPIEVLNKPGTLTKEEFDIMKRHVVDGAHILRKTPEMPALAPIVAFEHHLKQDLSGYPEHIGHRSLNLCTMIVSIADVFDALRSKRTYREGLATDRIRAIMDERDNPAFNQKLLKRFVNIMGLYPIGTLVTMNTDEIGVITAEHPSDPFRPQVKIIFSPRGERLEEPFLANTWERDSRGDYPRAVVDPVDPDSVQIDPLTLL